MYTHSFTLSICFHSLLYHSMYVFHVRHTQSKLWKHYWTHLARFPALHANKIPTVSLRINNKFVLSVFAKMKMLRHIFPYKMHEASNSGCPQGNQKIDSRNLNLPLRPLKFPAFSLWLTVVSNPLNFLVCMHKRVSPGLKLVLNEVKFSPS